MSTKIDGAYKVKGLTVDEVMTYLKELKEDYLNECVAFLKRVHGESLPGYGELFNELRESVKLSENSRFNFKASVMVYFHKGEMYVQFFGFDHCTDYKNLFDGHLIDYHYQDQVDPWYDYARDDGTLTDEEYDEAVLDYEVREQVWKEIYGEGAWRPNEVGLVFEIYEKMDVYTIMTKYKGE